MLSQSELAEFQDKQRKRGIIYVSRIPPGMTPAKFRHIFSQFGEVDRIYLQPKEHAQSGGKRKRSSSHFSEGWVEFCSKGVARSVADMLNAQPIGALGGAAHSSRKSRSGGVSNRWKDDVWTMKYLKGFRWPMLMEQMCTCSERCFLLTAAHERASHAARLRLELSQSAYEQRDYLKKVERARVQREKEAKRAKRGERGETTESSAPAPHTFGQRTPVYRDVRDQRAHGAEERQSATMGEVLHQIF